MRPVVLFGNGPNASANRYYLANDSDFEVVAFTVDREYLRDETLDGLPVVPFDEVERRHPPGEFAMSLPVGFVDLNRLRAERARQAREKGYALVSYVSSSAMVWPDLALGDNCFLYEGCTVKPFATIGDDVVLEAGSLVGHHAAIGDHCFVAPNAVILGTAVVEPYCFIGANATIGHGARIARECIVGAGATVMRSTRPGQIYTTRGTARMPRTNDALRRILTG